MNIYVEIFSFSVQEMAIIIMMMMVMTCMYVEKVFIQHAL